MSDWHRSVKRHKTAMLNIMRSQEADERETAERKWQAGLRPTKVQHACDHGLFSDEALQLDLVEMFQTEEE